MNSNHFVQLQAGENNSNKDGIRAIHVKKRAAYRLDAEHRPVGAAGARDCLRSEYGPPRIELRLVGACGLAFRARFFRS